MYAYTNRYTHVYACNHVCMYVRADLCIYCAPADSLPSPHVVWVGLYLNGELQGNILELQIKGDIEEIQTNCRGTLERQGSFLGEVQNAKRASIYLCFFLSSFLQICVYITIRIYVYIYIDYPCGCCRRHGPRIASGRRLCRRPGTTKVAKEAVRRSSKQPLVKGKLGNAQICIYIIINVHLSFVCSFVYICMYIHV